MWFAVAAAARPRSSGSTIDAFFFECFPLDDDFALALTDSPITTPPASCGCVLVCFLCFFALSSAGAAGAGSTCSLGTDGGWEWVFAALMADGSPAPGGEGESAPDPPAGTTGEELLRLLMLLLLLLMLLLLLLLVRLLSCGIARMSVSLLLHLSHLFFLLLLGNLRLPLRFCFRFLLLLLLLPFALKPSLGADLLERELHRRPFRVQVRIDEMLRVAAPPVRIVRLLQAQRNVPRFVVVFRFAHKVRRQTDCVTRDGRSMWRFGLRCYRRRSFHCFPCRTDDLFRAQRVLLYEIGIVVDVAQRGGNHPIVSLRFVQFLDWLCLHLQAKIEDRHGLLVIALGPSNIVQTVERPVLLVPGDVVEPQIERIGPVVPPDRILPSLLVGLEPGVCYHATTTTAATLDHGCSMMYWRTMTVR
uniref:Uncharacterized protein n=1 Tax=Anopheles merus TaxID=30066 RepID=A0A182V0W3_ANOME